MTDWKENLGQRIVLDNGAYMIKSSLASKSLPADEHFNGVVKDRNGKNIIGNAALREINEGSSGSRFHNIIHPQVRGIL